MRGDRGGRLLDLATTVEAAAVFLFFFQSLRVLFSALFGVVYDVLFAGTVSMAVAAATLGAVILALLAPLASPVGPRRRAAVALSAAVLVAAARVPLTLNEPQVRLGASILIVAGAGLYLPVRLRQDAGTVARAIVLALLADHLLRAAGQTFDVTLRTGWWPGQVAVSAGLCLLAAWPARQAWQQRPAGGISLGLAGALLWAGWLFLESSVLAFPNALARWSGEPYLVFASFWPVVLVLALLAGGLFVQRRGPVSGALVLAVLLLGLAAGALLGGTAAAAGLVAAQCAALSVLFTCLAPRSDGQAPGLRGGLALGGVLFLVVSFAYAFSFTYAYTLDLFRGTGPAIVLLAGVLAGLPLLHRRPAAADRLSLSRGRWWLIWGCGAAAALVAFVLAVPPRRAVAPAWETLRGATYNIHYGYDGGWHLSLEAQAQAIEQSGADVVALQEVDAGRPTSYMIDDALWLARRLDMEAVYLPCVEKLTGIALLSRFPVLESETLLLPSELEQTGIIWASLDVAGRPVNAFAIWLGLEPEERARQLDAALPFLAAHPGPALFGGDFNSDPQSPEYSRIAAAGLVDPFPALGLGSPPTSPAVGPTERIDFVWLREMAPVWAAVPDSPASDHRMVVVEAAVP